MKNIRTSYSIFFSLFLTLPFLYMQYAHSYEGRESDAEWRWQANQQIEKNRKAPLIVSVSDQDGNPIETANIHIKMTRHSFAFGSAVGAYPLTMLGSDFDQYRKIVADQYNKVVLENDLKWDQWEESKTNPSGSRYYNPQTFDALRWLKEKNISVRGHYISWGPVERLDAYQRFKDNPEAFRHALFEHIKDKIPKIENLVTEWDTVNHPIGWDQKLISLSDLFGQAIYVDIFKLAKELNPNVRLYINEGGLLPMTKNREKQQDQYAKLIRYLIDNEAPLDGIGFMGHFDHNKLTPPRELWRTLDRFARFGLPLQVTEFDVRFGEKGKPYNLSEDELRLQADYTRDFMTAVFSHPAVEGIVMWGFWEGKHYQPSAALYRKDWSIKPNGNVWKELVLKQWWTDVNGKTDSKGIYKTQGFLGDYEIEVHYMGERKTVKIKLIKDGIKVDIVL